jgi:methyl coenzyme M reductase subunit C
MNVCMHVYTYVCFLRTTEGLSPKTMGNSAMTILPKETDCLRLLVVLVVAVVDVVAVVVFARRLLLSVDDVKQLLWHKLPLAIFQFRFWVYETSETKGDVCVL